MHQLPYGRRRHDPAASSVVPALDLVPSVMIDRATSLVYGPRHTAHEPQPGPAQHSLGAQCPHLRPELFVEALELLHLRLQLIDLGLQ